MKEVIEQLANNLLLSFDDIYHSAEIVTADGNRFPAISQADEWVNLSPSDTKETIYIRRNGDDEVMEEARLASCSKSYKMRTPVRIVYFKDHNKDNSILPKLMQAVLISSTKLAKIVQDKWKLLKDESSGDYNFGANTAYFAIDIYLMWYLIPDTCEEDFCLPLENPLKKCLVAV